MAMHSNSGLSRLHGTRGGDRRTADKLGTSCRPRTYPPIGAQTAWTIRRVMAIHKGRSAPLLRVSSLTGALSLSRFLRFGVPYLRWLDVHPAGRAGQRLGDLAVCELDVVCLGFTAGLYRDGSAEGFE